MSYKTVILKLSGEALSGDKGNGLCPEILKFVSKQIAQVANSGIRIGVVTGSGNIWRGKMDTDMDRSTADDMGMIATVINALALKDYIIRAGAKAEVLSAVQMNKFAQLYTTRRTNELMDKGCVVIFACGTGNPFFTTDTAGALRACELSADAYIQAKSIDYVYDSDPSENPNAKAFSRISYDYILEHSLNAFDLTASIMLKNNNIDSVMFLLRKEQAIVDVCKGKKCGTIISNENIIEYV